MLCSGKYVMPGGIDMNVHLQRPGYGTQTIDDFYQVSYTGSHDFCLASNTFKVITSTRSVTLEVMT